MKVIVISLLLALLLESVVMAKSANCDVSNDVVDSMAVVEVTISREDGSSISFMAKLADDNQKRAAGFQRICESTMIAMPILFTFESEVVPSFHMNNVVASIDIAFIRKNAMVDVIHTMKPYSVMSLKKPLYSSIKPIVAALETHQGFFEKNNVDVSSRIHWKHIATHLSAPES